MNSAEMHDARAAQGMDEAMRAVWDQDDWDAGIDYCMERVGPVDGLNVIDFGCGVGRLMVPMLESGAADVIGSDPSEAMRLLAAERLRGAGVSDAWWLVERTDGWVEDGWADLVVSVCVLQHLPAEEQDASLAEMMRCVRPGGRVVAQVVHGADVGEFSNPVDPWQVCGSLAVASASLHFDPTYPTWAWLTATKADAR